MATQAVDPEWIREKEVTAKFGLTHMIIFDLRKRGEIRSVSLKEEGKKRGARIFDVASIRAYIARQEALELAATQGGAE